MFVRVCFLLFGQPVGSLGRRFLAVDLLVQLVEFVGRLFGLLGNVVRLRGAVPGRLGFLRGIDGLGLGGSGFWRLQFLQLAGDVPLASLQVEFGRTVCLASILGGFVGQFALLLREFVDFFVGGLLAVHRLL